MGELIKAIPTIYEGVRFRSRLEARWAAFFDLAGWPWEYEPFDLEGWCPDFRLLGKIPGLVEVKPIDFAFAASHDPEDHNDTYHELAQAAASKVFRTLASWEKTQQPAEDEGELVLRLYEVLVLGNGPWRDSRYMSCWHIGTLGSWDLASLYGGYDRRLDYAAQYGSYRYRIGGEYDGDGHLRYLSYSDVDPDWLWRQAGNAVQWRRSS
jgi:hypothetical protein